MFQIQILCLKFSELQQSLLQFEESSITLENVQNVFNNVRELLNNKSYSFYNPKLILFQDYLERTDEYNKYNLTSVLQYQETIWKLQDMITVFETHEWALNTLQKLQSQVPDLDQFYSQRKKHDFDVYQKEMDALSQMTNKIQKNDKQKQIRAKIGNNNTYFVINQYEELAEGVPYTNPTIFSKFSKDVVFIFNNFEQAEVFNTTMLETCSLNDRIWMFAIHERKIINILQNLFQENYLSLIQTMFFQQNITKYIKQFKYQDQMVDFKFIQEIQALIELENQQQVYKVYNGTITFVSSSYTIFLLFTKQCNYYSFDLNLEAQLNTILIIISQQYNNQFLLRYNQYIDLFLVYTSLNEYRQNIVRPIIKYINQLMYDVNPVFGNVNRTIIFMKPVYINLEYIGCIYKLIDYDQFLTYNTYSLDQISRTLIKDTKTQRIMIDSFSQYSSPYYFANNNFLTYYQLQPVEFNQQDIDLTYQDYVKVSNQNVYDNIIMFRQQRNLQVFSDYYQYSIKMCDCYFLFY
ncbi:Conserved_hypothetical protein [Hexamita inflata]|uniref:Uncharacterized protein n=1 Tax=Hexamita inflata TaxID=28002 RepID=A0AA86RJI6_9EUKA|nr:Conserved hypothetical protein [Hexamita inflata]